MGMETNFAGGRRMKREGICFKLAFRGAVSIRKKSRKIAGGKKSALQRLPVVLLLWYFFFHKIGVRIKPRDDLNRRIFLHPKHIQWTYDSRMVKRSSN